jgi:MEMO1 family protein
MSILSETTVGGPETSPGGKRDSPVACAVLMPHAPILVPEIGGARGAAAEASRRAMREVAARVMNYQPQALVVISPHSPRIHGAFGLWAGERLHGSFNQFGASHVEVDLPNDERLARGIAAEAHAHALHTWSIQDMDLDHGALVPLWFLAEAGWSGPTVLLSLDYPDEGGLNELGHCIAAAARTLHRRIAVIASGDMSHRLTTDAPCGFHPQAHRFDEIFINRLRAGDYHKLGNLNPMLRERAAEDAVDSTLIAVSAVDFNTHGHKVLSYEGPFGVGYGVAILFEEETSSPPTGSGSRESLEIDGQRLPALARRSVEAALAGSRESPPKPSGEFLNSRHGVFVTLRERSGELRGCVGTLEPVRANVAAETARNAQLAALQNGRFPPVAEHELEDLMFEVSVIHTLETISSLNELDPARYGVVVSTSDGRRGVLLPAIENIRTVTQQVNLARRKACIDPDEPVTIQRFQVHRFQESD